MNSVSEVTSEHEETKVDLGAVEEAKHVESLDEKKALSLEGVAAVAGVPNPLADKGDELSHNEQEEEDKSST